MAASERFHNNDLAAPALWFFSEVDPIGSAEACVDVINKWKRRGSSVEYRCFHDSDHVQHIVKFEEEYKRTLFNFLDKHVGLQETEQGST